MKISVATSLYNSASYIRPFYERTLKALMQLGCDYEFVFVVDGSPDNSLEVALGVASEDPKVRVVELSKKNFSK